jgi:hypothetical protein
MDCHDDTFAYRRAILLLKLDRALAVLRLAVSEPDWRYEDYGEYVSARAEVDEVLRQLRGLNQVAMESRETEGG